MLLWSWFGLARPDQARPFILYTSIDALTFHLHSYAIQYNAFYIWVPMAEAPIHWAVLLLLLFADATFAAVFWVCVIGEWECLVSYLLFACFVSILLLFIHHFICWVLISVAIFCWNYIEIYFMRFLTSLYLSKILDTFSSYTKPILTV